MISKGYAGLSSLSFNTFDKGETTGKSSCTIDYTVGDTVSHATFGNGIVKDMVKKDSDFLVTVEFDDMGSKKMKASFAKLKKL